MSELGYSLSADEYGTTLVLEGPWSDDLLPVIEENKVTGLWINYARGFVGNDITFLKKLPDLKYLLIASYWLDDVSPINGLSNLRSLYLSATTYKGIDFSGLRRLEKLSLDYTTGMKSLVKCTSLRYLNVGSLRVKDLTILSELQGLDFLEVSSSPVADLDGIENLPHLRVIALYYLTKLTDISALAKCPRLEIVDIEACRKIGSIEPVRPLTRLKRLQFSKCGQIESLSPVGDLKDLVDLIFDYDTNIVDGDLDPMTKLKKLQYTYFLDRPHYNHRASEFPMAGMAAIRVE